MTTMTTTSSRNRGTIPVSMTTLLSFFVIVSSLVSSSTSTLVVEATAASAAAAEEVAAAAATTSNNAAAAAVAAGEYSTTRSSSSSLKRLRTRETATSTVTSAPARRRRTNDVATTNRRDLVEEKDDSNDNVMVWKPVRSYANAARPSSSSLSDPTVNNNTMMTTIGGRHHPITFANETHGFIMGGTVLNNGFSNNKLLIFEEQTQFWTDYTAEFLEINNDNNQTTFSSAAAAAAAAVLARSFGYGVVLPVRNHTKAYFGFGLLDSSSSSSSSSSRPLNDLWEFDMSTLKLKQLTPCPCLGRRHPSMVPVITTTPNNSTTSDIEESDRSSWQIHIGLGDGLNNSQFQNFNDYWSYDISTDSWNQLPNFPSSRRHHPFFFSAGLNHTTSYVGLGHSDGYEPYIERDFYSFSQEEEDDDDTVVGDGDDSSTISGGTWTREPDFESYDIGLVNISDDPGGSTQQLVQQQQSTPVLVTTEARVAGTQFSITLPLVGDDNDEETFSSNNETATTLKGSLGFVLSGDGDDHGPMATGEFHAFDPNPSSPVTWFELPPHPGPSRWAPGSWVMRGTTRMYFTSGYDRSTGTLYNDVWMIDVRPFFEESTEEGQEQDIFEAESTLEPPTLEPPTLEPPSNATATNSNRASMPSSSSSSGSSPDDPSEEIIQPWSSSSTTASSASSASRFGVVKSTPLLGGNRITVIIITTVVSTVLLPNHFLLL